MNIAVIGYGRFGQLFADIIKPFGQVHAMTEVSIRDSEIKRITLSELGEMDWVILAVPISAIRSTLQIIHDHLKPGVILMDVCSVKSLPCRWMLELAPPQARLLGTHPMFGPDSVRKGLAKLQMVFTPVRIEVGRMREIMDLFTGLQLNVVETTADDHDQQAAKSLSLVHFIGRTLAQIPIESQVISTLGFERLLKVNETVNNDSWQLFLDMQNYNPYAKEIRHKFIELALILNKTLEDNQGASTTVNTA
jgi:prephenate dehydrogenase